MNNRMIFAAGGGLAAVAVAIFLLMGSGIKFPVAPGQTQVATVTPPVVTIKDISVSKTDDNNANVQVTFTVGNLNNTRTIILETIHYNLFVGNQRITIGDVGASAEGFLDTQGNLFPVVAGTTITVKGNVQNVVRDTFVADSWDSMVAKTARYTVEGTYSYRLTATDMSTTASEKDFTLTFP